MRGTKQLWLDGRVRSRGGRANNIDDVEICDFVKFVSRCQIHSMVLFVFLTLVGGYSAVAERNELNPEVARATIIGYK